MKKMCAILGVALLAALLVLPGTAKSEMYIEGYLGGVAAPSDSQSFSQSGAGVQDVGVYRDPVAFGVDAVTYTAEGALRGSFPGRFDNPFFTGGMKLGIWFDKTGITGGYNWPDWAKYFGFYLDLSYHNLDFKKQLVNGSYAARFLSIWENTDALPGLVTVDQYQESGAGTLPGTFSSNGRMFTLAFMFAARYGFLPDSEVPFGRLQPYIAVGPALFVSSQSPSFSSNFSAGDTLVNTPVDELGVGALGPGPYTGRIHNVSLRSKTKSSVDIGLAVDAGIRYYMLKNVSLDVFFKYRWVEPSYNYTLTTTLRHPEPGFFGAPLPDDFVGSGSFTIKPTYHLFSGNVGVAYHF
jgi:hypothetical protein